MARMLRIQVCLPPEWIASLDGVAARRGMSRSALIREAARQLVAEEETSEEDSILGIIGIGYSEHTDVSERHDDYLVQDLLDDMHR
jgi:metal-responsive CopG/Arc/MetJ family transcriptional regulator